MTLLNLLLKPLAWLAFAAIMIAYFTALILGGLLFAIVKPVEAWQLVKEFKQLKEQ